MTTLTLTRQIHHQIHEHNYALDLCKYSNLRMPGRINITTRPSPSKRVSIHSHRTLPFDGFQFAREHSNVWISWNSFFFSFGSPFTWATTTLPHIIQNVRIFCLCITFLNKNATEMETLKAKIISILSVKLAISVRLKSNQRRSIVVSMLSIDCHNIHVRSTNISFRLQHRKMVAASSRHQSSHFVSFLSIFD